MKTNSIFQLYLLLLICFLCYSSPSSHSQWSVSYTITDPTPLPAPETWYSEDPLYLKKRWTHTLNVDYTTPAKYTSYKKLEVWSGCFGETAVSEDITYNAVYYTIIFSWDGMGDPPYGSHSIDTHGSSSSYANAITDYAYEEYAESESSGVQVNGARLSYEGSGSDSNEQWSRGVTGAKGKLEDINFIDYFKAWQSINVSATFSSSPSLSVDISWQNPYDDTRSYMNDDQSLELASSSLDGTGQYWTYKWIDKGFQASASAYGSTVQYASIVPSMAWTSGTMFFYY